MKASDQLKVFSNGNEVPGFIVYGLAGVGVFDSEMEIPGWIGQRQVARHRLSGKHWEVMIWEVAVSEWPADDAWAEVLAGALVAMIDSGAVVSWVDSEGAPFADPPLLFDPALMSGSVLAWRSIEGHSGGSLELGSPIRPIDDTELAFVRRLASGLADSD